MTTDELRRHYMGHGLAREEMDADPYKVFHRWFQEAIESGIAEPNSFSLATVNGDGQPWLRTVLLKTYDENGFVFYTNYTSRKASQIDHNARVAMLFPWVALARQVKVTGKAAKVTAAESLAYFASRPRGSQIGAWASPQSQVITSRSLLEQKFMEMKRKFAEGEIPLPDFWGGYRIVPETIEFWQGRDNRLHDRFMYTLTPEGHWQLARLAP